MSVAAVAQVAGPIMQGLGSLLGGGGGQEQTPSNLHLVNPQQQLLYNRMIQQLMGGAGDFGYGSNIKQGSSQLQQMMASRGVKVGSGGAYTGAYGNMVGNALGQDATARRQYAMNLLQTPLQIASTTGANFIPGSVSAGVGVNDQMGEFDMYRTQGLIPRGAGGITQRQGETWTNTPFGKPRGSLV